MVKTGMGCVQNATQPTFRRIITRKLKEYKTTYSEIDVSCEACHGPGSKHEEWAKLAGNGPFY